jgi:hypothetical protein
VAASSFFPNLRPGLGRIDLSDSDEDVQIGDDKVGDDTPCGVEEVSSDIEVASEHELAPPPPVCLPVSASSVPDAVSGQALPPRAARVAFEVGATYNVRYNGGKKPGTWRLLRVESLGSPTPAHFKAYCFEARQIKTYFDHQVLGAVLSMDPLSAPASRSAPVLRRILGRQAPRPEPSAAAPCKRAAPAFSRACCPKCDGRLAEVLVVEAHVDAFGATSCDRCLNEIAVASSSHRCQLCDYDLCRTCSFQVSGKKR